MAQVEEASTGNSKPETDFNWVLRKHRESREAQTPMGLGFREPQTPIPKTPKTLNRSAHGELDDAKDHA